MKLLELYERMALARAYELAVGELWQQGLINGEMHLGTGEEAVMAGVVPQLRDGDGLALDHRPTAAMLLRGVDPLALLQEMLGHEEGLCGGRGGHMHLFSKAHCAASSGIVGAAAPTAAGFALASKQRGDGGVAVGFFGDGAINQGMVLETLNLAVVWKLPVIFVCKDNGWAITTRSTSVTSGKPIDRAVAVKMAHAEVDGLDVQAVFGCAHKAIDRARAGRGPTFLQARCSRLDGHLLGDPLITAARSPLKEGKEVLGPVIRAALSGEGGGLMARAKGMIKMTGVLARARSGGDKRDGKQDPLRVARRALRDQSAEVDRIDEAVSNQVAEIVSRALQQGGER